MCGSIGRRIEDECIAKIAEVVKGERDRCRGARGTAQCSIHDLLHPSRLKQVDARLVPVQVLHPVLDRIVHVERFVLLDVAPASTVQAA